MAQKNNIRSIRFSDEMAELIDRQVGDTFTQKFENLVTRCVWELPVKEQELARVQAQIDQARETLCDIQWAVRQLKAMEQDIRNAQRHLAFLEQRAKGAAEAVEKNGL